MSRYIVCLAAVLLSQSAWSMGDPTRPTAYRGEVAATKNYELQSVLVGGSRKIAFINGKPLSVGDSLGSARVVSIGKNKVVLRSHGREIELEAGRTTVIRKEQWLVSES